MTDAKTSIDETVKSNDVVLYMKGTKDMPQCGFSSTEEGNKITVDDQRRKLELVVETARAIWGGVGE